MAKSPEMNKALDSLSSQLFGKTRSMALNTGTCVTCEQPARMFRDELSRKEYRISGMCQVCQDAVFSSEE